MNTGDVDQLPEDPELATLLDRLRRMGFRPVVVPWTAGVDNGVARYLGTTYDLLLLPLHNFASVTRAEIVNDTQDPSRLLRRAETLFIGNRLAAAQFLLDLVDPPTVDVDHRQVAP